MGMQGISMLNPIGPARRKGRRTPPIAMIERLEQRLALDAGAVAVAAAASVASAAQPQRFASAAEWKQYLIDAAVEQWRSLLGQHYPRIPDGAYGPIGDVALEAPMPLRTAALAADSAHSGTNNQVDGVDEGDTVETDGQFLYILAGRALKIVDARQPEALAIISTTAIEGVPVAEHLNGTRLTVISRVDGPYGFPTEPLDADVARVALLPFVYTPPKLKVTEFDVADVADAAAPRELRATTLDGSYVQSRAVGDRVTVVVQHNLDSLPPPETRTTDDEYIYPTEAEYRAQLEALDITPTLPQFTSQANGPDGAVQASGPLLGFDAIYRPASPDDQSLLSVVTFDAQQAAPGPAGAVGVVAPYSATVYATADHLYLVGNRWSYVPDGASSETTVIQKFALNGDAATLTAVGTVPGRALNQFAIDEHDSYLRIATTSVSFDGTTVHSTNSLYILAERDGTLEAVGSLTDLAPGEQIYATRFFGDRAFLVTFRQVDPLFALDLSDPTAPRSVGELKVPGFSRYLHPVDATHVVGIGREVDPVTNRTRGLQVSLFDVADLAHPSRVDVEEIVADGYVWSEAEFEHHAVSFFPESGILAIPVNIEPYYSWDGTAEPTAPRYELRVFRVDPDGGLTPLGQVQHDSPVLRAVNIGDALFSISSDAVKASPVLDPSTTLGQVVLRDPGEGDGDWPGGPIIPFLPLPPIAIDVPLERADQPVPTDPPPGPTVEPVVTSVPGVGTTVTAMPLPPDPLVAARPAVPSADTTDTASIPMPLGEGFRRSGRVLRVSRRRLALVGATHRQAVPRPLRIQRLLGGQQTSPVVRRAQQARLADPGQSLGPVSSRRLEAVFRRLLARHLG
jgi:uncharacterized secreted protein with C-terminal beta-propeller domain